MAQNNTPTNGGVIKIDRRHVDGITESMSNSEQLAVLATQSSLSAITLHQYAGVGDNLAVTDLMAAMKGKSDAVVSGDMGTMERMLVNQALTLDAMFNNLAQRAHRQDSFKGIEVLLRLAMKAQAQARSTAEALALLKNPMPYIRQANMTTGPQQINNGVSPGTHAENFESEPSKLLEADHGQRLDIGAAQASSRVNQAVGAVGKINRAKVTRG